MNLDKKFDFLMKNQEFFLTKNEDKSLLSSEILSNLGVKKHSEFYKFYTKYFGRALISSRSFCELIDPCPPQDMVLTTKMAHKNWGVPKNYILFTTGEGEGGYLYRVDDDTVWDFTLGEQDILGTNKMRHWNSFYEFLEWYLTQDETE